MGEQGTVWQRDETGELTAIDVVLGLTDGEMIEIVSGLGEEDEVLQFVPSMEDPFGPEWGDPGWEEFPEEEWIDDGVVYEEEFEC